MNFGYQRRCFGVIFLLLLQVELFLAKTQVSYLSSFQTSSSLLRGRELLGCNLFKGKWVVDNSYPLYAASSCPYIDSEFDCLKHGRKDTLYLKYAWQPDSCNLPRYIRTHPSLPINTQNQDQIINDLKFVRAN